MKTVKIILLLGLLVLIILLSTFNIPSTPATNVRIAIQAGKSLNSFFPMYVAENKGFFKEEGLNVTIIQTGPTQSTNALISKSMEFSYDLPTVINAKLSGADIKIIMAFADYDNYLYSNLSSVSELKGKKIAIASAGGIGYTRLYFLLKNYSMNISDVDLIVISEINQRVLALKSGFVDAANLPNTAFKQGELKMNIYLAENSTSSRVGGLITTGSFANENPETVMKVTRAIAKAIKYIYSDRIGTEELIKNGLDVDEEKAKELYDFILHNHYYTTKLDLKGLDAEIKDIAEASGKTPMPAENFVNSTFVNSLPKELQI